MAYFLILLRILWFGKWENIGKVQEIQFHQGIKTMAVLESKLVWLADREMMDFMQQHSGGPALCHLEDWN